MEISVDVKQAKREFFRIRGKFLKLQRTVVGEALTDAAAPVVATARAGAPRLTGRLQQRIGVTAPKNFRGKLNVAVGPLRFSKGDKLFPFYGKFQERGWKHTGRAKRGTAKGFTQIPAKNFLRNAGTQNFGRSQQIFAEKVFRGFAEIQSAGEAAGLV